MIVTDKFIYIHIPKTGGTFVTHMLDKIDRGTVARKIRRLFFRKRYLNIFKHGTCSNIPVEYIHLPIFSTVRNPFDRYVSQYEFKWWKTHPEDFAGLKEWKKHCVDYPQITFDDFVTVANKIFYQYPEICRKRNIGFHTEQFIIYFFKNPEQVLKKINSNYINSKSYIEDMHQVKFIRTENLNIELYNYLLSMGYGDKEISFILRAGKVNPVEGGRSPDQKWSDYFNSKLKNLVREKERYLFSIFPEYDI